MFAAVPISVGTSQVLPPSVQLHGFKPAGPAPNNLPILVTLAIPLRNVALLDSMVMQVSDPSSPLYRHFLTPAQLRSDFLPVGTYDSLTAYLRASGFTIEMTALDSEVVVQGTVSQFQTAFGGSIETYTN